MADYKFDVSHSEKHCHNIADISLFSSVFSSYSENTSVMNMQDYLSNVVPLLSEIILSTNEVADCLKAINTTKACGPIGVPVRLLKECAI